MSKASGKLERTVAPTQRSRPPQDPAGRDDARGRIRAWRSAAGRSRLAQAQQRDARTSRQPNILVIFGDDIGYWNVSAYNRGMMGYRTPNIDRIAKEGAIFTDHYAQQSCTAGRAAFITGQSLLPHRPAEGRPAGREGRALREGPDARRAAQAAGLRDRPVRQEPPRRPQRVSCRRCTASTSSSATSTTSTPRTSRSIPTTRRIPSSAPSSARAACSSARRATRTIRRRTRASAASASRPSRTPARSPRSAWRRWTRSSSTRRSTSSTGSTRPASRSSAGSTPPACTSTRILKPESKGKTGLGLVADGMTEFDGMVGQLLKKLDDLGIADNTIVVWTTDNGAEVFSWPDGGTTPFKGEKNTNWEGGYRVPCVMRWPGVIKPGTEINDITSHEDFVPTLVAAAGEPNVKEKLLTGYQAAGKTFKVHLDGYDQRDLLAGTGPGKRKEFFYWTDDGNLAGLRYDRWKIVFMEQRAEGLDVWQDPLVPLRFPKLIDLRADPFERAQTDAGDYERWRVEHAFVLVPAQAYVAKHLADLPRVSAAPEGRAASRSIRCWRSCKRAATGGDAGTSRHGGDARRHLPHGLRPPSSGGSASPMRQREGFWIDRTR